MLVTTELQKLRSGLSNQQFGPSTNQFTPLNISIEISEANLTGAI
jgi:hypothetical protein